MNLVILIIDSIVSSIFLVECYVMVFPNIWKLYKAVWLLCRSIANLQRMLALDILIATDAAQMTVMIYWHYAMQWVEASTILFLFLLELQNTYWSVLPGCYFGNYFIMGGERFDTSQQDTYLFGENEDLNFLGSKPVPVSDCFIVCSIFFFCW